MGLTGFDMSLLDRKYAAMEKQADADMIRANAAASAASSSGYSGLRSLDPLARLQADVLRSEIAKNNAAAAGARSATSIAEDQNLEQQRLNDQNYNSNTLSRDTLSKMYDYFNQQNPDKLAPSNKKGVAKVPKTGTTKVHKGEAILNKPAADTLGRGLIAALNIKGQQKMGMV